MRNEFFHAEDAKQKRLKMRKIIRRRIKDIEPRKLELILDALDYDRQYFVKIMRNPQKFRNIIVNELVQTPDNDIHSESFHLYGEFTCGLYKKTETELISKQSTLNEQNPAAALKYVKTVSGGFVRSSHEIVIYQPENIV